MKTYLVILSASLLLMSNMSTADENFRTHGPVVGDPQFLEAGEWWNLFCTDNNDPLKRSVRAVKILHASKEHRGWVKIAFPQDRDEHSSIFGPAANAHRDDSVSMKDALAKWEESVTEWKSVWINLDFVVSASRVAKNPSAEEELEKAVKSGVEEVDVTIKEMIQYMEKETRKAYGTEGYGSENYDVAAPDERSLEKVVLRVNEQLQTDYELLEPAPITVGRFREAIKAKIETLAKSEEEDGMRLVKALQRILAENRLPERFLFFLAPTSASYKKQSLDEGVLDKKVVNLSYNLIVPVRGACSCIILAPS